MADKKQHRSPCAECPFARRIKPGALGGSPPEVYVGQANGNFFLPCHATDGYRSPNARLNQENPQCAGAAVFRSNVGVADRIPPALLHLPADADSVFASFAEFYAHHAEIPLAEAEARLSVMTPDALTRLQLQISMVRVREGKATLDIVPKKTPDAGR